MMETIDDDQLIVYTSNFCAHSWIVERLLRDHKVPAQFINIDGDVDARRQVMDLNNGYASVPTLIFPDGTQMSEPALRSLRRKLNIETPGVLDRLRAFIGK